MSIRKVVDIFLTSFLFILAVTVSHAGVYNYEYDNLHRLTRVEHSNGTIVVFNYDNVGNRTSKVVSTGTLIDAQFTSDLTNGFAPLQVVFTDQSVGNITSWLWVFGDGQTSSEQHPVHSYLNPGTYTVSLTVSGPDGSDTIDIPNLISVGTNPGSPVISVDPTSRSVGDSAGTTTFTVENAGTGTMNWNATTSDSWLSILDGSSGTDSGTITVTYAENAGAERTGSITIASTEASNSPQTVQIIQASATGPDLSIGSPVAGEVWELGSTYDIQWFASSAYGISQIRIYLHTADDSITVTTLDTNPGIYSWTIPPSTNYLAENARIRVVAVDGNGDDTQVYSPYFSVQDSAAPPLPWNTPERLTTAIDLGVYISENHTGSAIAVDNAGDVHLVYRYIEDEYFQETTGSSDRQFSTGKKAVVCGKLRKRSISSNLFRQTTLHLGIVSLTSGSPSTPTQIPISHGFTRTANQLSRLHRIQRRRDLLSGV